MNKELIDKFIKAEQIGEQEIVKLYDKLFEKSKKDYKKLAELSLVIDNRVDENLNNDRYSSLYIAMSASIIWWANEKFNTDEYDKFCWISDNYSIIKEMEN